MTERIRRAAPAIVAVSVVLAACDPGAADEPAGPRPDAGLGAQDGSAACEVPTSGFGSRVGTHAPPLTLTDCAGQPYDLYGPDFCTAALTVVDFEAGWCTASGLVTDRLTSQVIEPYAARGVRVIQVLQQNEAFAAPDTTFCHQWITRHALFGSVELIDPTGFSQILTPASSFPTYVVLDRTGTIRARGTGIEAYTAAGASDLGELTRTLDALLAETR